MPKNLLFINPWIHDFSAYDFWLKPLGLLYMASFMREHGYNVFLLDFLNRFSNDLINFLGDKERKRIKSRYYGMGRFPVEEVEKPKFLEFVPRRYKRYGFPKKLVIDTLKRLSGESWDAVFITSTMTYWYPGVWETISTIKEFMDSPIFLGGLYPYFFPDHAKKSRADFVITSPLMDHIAEELSRIMGFEPKMEMVKGWFNELKPMYELYQDNSKLEYAVILTSLGCPFRCTYCATPVIYGGKFHVRKVDKVLSEIEELLEHGVRNIVFFDDAFLIPPDRAKKILRGIIERGYNEAFFHLPNGIHVRLIDEGIAYLLKKANFKTIILGVETLDPSLQKSTGGKVKSHELDRAVHLLKSAGFDKELRLYLMINMPNQSYESARLSIEGCMEYGIRIHLNEYTPIPRTKDWERLVKEGKLDPDIDPVLLNNTVLPYWWKNGLNADEVEKLKRIVGDYNNELKVDDHGNDESEAIS